MHVNMERKYQNPDGEWVSKPQGAPVTWRPSAYGAAVRDGKVLCIRAAWGSRWQLPGGGVEIDEEIKESVRREMMEETPYDVVDIEDAPFSLHETWFYDTLLEHPVYNHAIVLTFHVEVSQNPIERKLGVEEGEVDTCEWVDFDMLTEETVHYAFWPAIKKLKEFHE